MHQRHDKDFQEIEILLQKKNRKIEQNNEIYREIIIKLKIKSGFDITYFY